MIKLSFFYHLYHQKRKLGEELECVLFKKFSQPLPRILQFILPMLQRILANDVSDVLNGEKW
jgi:hypothetical protein